MKVLLLSMPNITPSSADSMILPSLGIASLAGNVDPKCHQIRLLDLVLVRKKYLPVLAQWIDELQPQIVGLSGLTCSLHTALEIAEFIKIRFPNILITFGGYMALCHFEELIQPDKAKWVDFIVRGEAEKTFPELLDELDGSHNFQQIAGLAFKVDGQFISNAARELSPLSDIRLPARSARISTKGLHFWNIQADVLETSRGCTFDCAFCCVTQQYGRTHRSYSLYRVMEDMERAYANGARFMVLVDDNITLNMNRLDQLCDEIIHARLKGLKFFAQAAVKPIATQPELVKKMRAAGFVSVFLGLENLIQRNLDFLNKKTSGYEMAARAIKNLRKNRIISTAGIIMGNPDDTEEDLWKNYRLIRNLKVDFPNFMTLTPFPKTRVRAELQIAGLLTNPTDYSRYDLIQANVRTKHISSEHLYRLVKIMFHKYYFSFRFVAYNLFIRKYIRFTLQYAIKELFHDIVSSFIRKKHQHV